VGECPSLLNLCIVGRRRKECLRKNEQAPGSSVVYCQRAFARQLPQLRGFALVVLVGGPCSSLKTIACSSWDVEYGFFRWAGPSVAI
jgi:hypothetical protein